MSDDKLFGVYTGTTSRLIECPSPGQSPLADKRRVFETTDGLTHHIRVIDQTGKYLRYILRHNQKEYLRVYIPSELHPADHRVTCMICLVKGPEPLGKPYVDDAP